MAHRSKWRNHQLTSSWIDSMVKMPVYRHIHHKNWYIVRVVRSYYGETYDALELKTDDRVWSRHHAMTPNRFKKWFVPITDEIDRRETLALIIAIFFL